MAHYIQLLTLTPEGRERLLRDPEAVYRAQRQVESESTRVLGLYAVLGEYDFVCILEAEDNEAAARSSVKLGVLAGAHITTLPAVPTTLLQSGGGGDPSDLETGAQREPAVELSR